MTNPSSKRPAVKGRLLKRVAITTGDYNGIGFEVTAKSLVKLRLKTNKTGAIIILFRHKKHSQLQKKYFTALDKHYVRLTFTSAGSAISYLDSVGTRLPKNVLIDIALSENEAKWVFYVTQLCIDKKIDSLVTGPLSKSKSVVLPGRPIGHTGIFRQFFPKIPLKMAFLGDKFNVLLATDHVPFSSVEKLLMRGELAASVRLAFGLRNLLKDSRPVAVLGLNPHSGESGLIGKFEYRYKKLFKSSTCEGPLVPDAAFLKENLKKYSLFVALYHDQGLIPFKSHHGQDSGVHITVGLPFLRTSVDHGTAFDIFNKDLANPHSMRDAILLNLRMLKAKGA